MTDTPEFRRGPGRPRKEGSPYQAMSDSTSEPRPGSPEWLPMNRAPDDRPVVVRDAAKLNTAVVRRIRSRRRDGLKWVPCLVWRRAYDNTRLEFDPVEWKEYADAGTQAA